MLSNPEELGQLCRELREQEGMTMQELATAIGERHRQSINNAEKATDTSRLSVQKKILSFFGKKLDILFRVT